MPEHSSTKLTLRFLLCMAKCYQTWPLFPHGFKFRQHKRQPVPPEPGPTGLVSADPDTVGGWTPICSEDKSLEKLDKQAFLIQSLFQASLGPCILFIDPARDSSQCWGSS